MRVPAAVSEQERRMDLYSILGQPVSSNEIHSFTSGPLPRPPLSAPSIAPLSHEVRSNYEILGNEDAFAVRAVAEAKLSATLHSAVERVRYITGASGVALALCES